MEDVKERKQKLRKEMERNLAALTEAELRARADRIESRLFQFANFQESDSVLFYFRPDSIFDGPVLFRHCRRMSKSIILPSFETSRMKLWRVENPDTDIISGESLFSPDTGRCKPVTADSVDIAVIPGTAFDEKGGRLGSGQGFYDRLAGKLPATVRKIALAFEDQIISHVPMEANDKSVDIIITEKRIIYKI